MYREKINDLRLWKEAGSRKPLIIRGARQVGKTWLMKEFGKIAYEHTIYLNFEKNPRLKSLFNDDFNIGRILTGLQAETGLQIRAENSLLIFDEIQAIPEAITALKYFHEDAPQYHILAAGSLLGVAIQAKVSFPVGKVSFMDLHPLTFNEFLIAMAESELNKVLESDDWKLIGALKSRYRERLKQYYYTGGMPEVVAAFAADQDFTEVRNIQKNILLAFEQDFSKHAPNVIIPRIRMLWNSVPAQLAKENRKFIYGIIREGARAREYELALNWLYDCRLVSLVRRVGKPGIPLKAYEDPASFKLFIVDVGLLGALSDLDPRSQLDGNAVFTEFKGALTEQYVFQQLMADGRFVINYWTAERSTSEVDFVLQYQSQIIPVEVKAEENLQAKSLKVYHEKFNPALAVRTSMSDYRRSGWLVNIPLYAIRHISRVT